MTIPEFKTSFQEREASAIKLFDIAMIQAIQQRERSPDMGFAVEVTLGDIKIKLRLIPNPRVSGGGWSKEGRGSAAQGPPKFDKAGVEAVIMANQDMLNYQDKDGKIIISPKKFLGDLWAGINEDLKKYGMKWVSAGKESRWEGQS